MAAYTNLTVPWDKRDFPFSKIIVAEQVMKMFEEAGVSTDVLTRRINTFLLAVWSMSDWRKRTRVAEIPSGIVVDRHDQTFEIQHHVVLRMNKRDKSIAVFHPDDYGVDSKHTVEAVIDDSRIVYAMQ